MTEIWEEPVRGSYGDISFLGLDGLERMKVSMDGMTPTPPIYHLTGVHPVEVGRGSAVFEMPASPWWLTGPGVFSAGVMPWAADAALGCAIITTLPPGKILVTSDLTMSFLRPASPRSERLVARARLIHAGRSLGLSEVSVEDGSGRLLAHGTARCFLFEPIVPTPSPPESFEPWVAPEYDTPDPYLRPPPPGVLSGDVFEKMSGLEILKAFLAGELPRPPMASLLGGRYTEAEEGRATFVLPATEWLASPARAMYGGAFGLLADLAMSGAVWTTVPARTAFAPLDLKVNFLRPVRTDGRDLVARGTVTHRGRTLAVATCEIDNAEGKRVAVATGSTLILPDRPWTVDRPVVAEEEAAGEDD